MTVLMVNITCDLDRSVGAAHGVVSPPLALKLCKSLALKIQDQTFEPLPKSGNAHDYSTSSLFLLLHLMLLSQISNEPCTSYAWMKYKYTT